MILVKGCDVLYKEIISFIKSLVIATIAAVLIITFVFQVVNVDKTSMYPTLKPNDRLILEKVTYYFSKPSRGDIVVFKYPKDNREKFIKRVIGIPGDKIKIENGILYINGEKQEESYIKEAMIGDFSETTVPEGTIFALGDNRNNSMDSRDESVGFIPYKLIIGKAVFRIYPLDSIGRLN